MVVSTGAAANVPTMVRTQPRFHSASSAITTSGVGDALAIAGLGLNVAQPRIEGNVELVELGDRLAQPGERGRKIARLHELDHALLGLARALGLLAAQVVEAPPGVGVEHLQRPRIGLHALQKLQQGGVLDDIGEIAGVKGVAIVHRREAQGGGTDGAGLR